MRILRTVTYKSLNVEVQDGTSRINLRYILNYTFRYHIEINFPITTFSGNSTEIKSKL